MSIVQCSNISIQSEESRCSKLNEVSNYNNKMQPEKWIPMKSDHQACKEQEVEKLNDGTSCFIEGYNKSVCVNGTCQHVGCDGIVQSNTRYDHCGICGGTGESCGRTIFQWRDTKQFSPCDATCGPNGEEFSSFFFEME
uniref:ADAMTS/ADAMTS-like cysteine-rich domain-containing protein n=1 Tax=Setaria digitata TaxID=48799 RepID=A0A915Q0F7_9BILA